MPVFCEKYLISDIFEKMNVIIRNAFDCQKCDIYIYDNLTKELWSQDYKNSNSVFKLPTDKGIPGFIVDNKVNVILEDAYFDPRFSRENDLKTGYRTRSLLAVPILHGENNEVLGKCTSVINDYYYRNDTSFK